MYIFFACENPHEINEKRMSPQKVTLWCGFRSVGLFFENEAGNAVLEHATGVLWAVSGGYGP